MNAAYKLLNYNIRESYFEVFKQVRVPLVALLILNFLLPHLLTFLFSIFVIGILYLQSYRILLGETHLTLKESARIVGKRYLPALALTLSVIGICIFAFVCLAIPFDLLPNSLLSIIIAYGPFDILLLIIFTVLFVLTTVYVSYSLSFFWIENTGILDSLQKSYELVKGQWWRAARYVFSSQFIPVILFLVIPLMVIGLISKIFGLDFKQVLSNYFIHGLILVLTFLFVLPLQVVLNISYFEKLKLG